MTRIVFTFKKRTYLSIFTALLLFSGAENAFSQSWEGITLGFTPPEPGLLGDIAGLRSGLENYGFYFNAGYLSQLAVNNAGGYNSDKHKAYIDQFSLTFQQDLEALSGISDAKIEGNIVNRNHDDNLTTKRLQDTRVGINDSTQESAGGGSITRLGWLTFSRSFYGQRLHWRIGLMNKVQDFDQIIPCDFQMLSQCGAKSANSLTWYNWNVHYWGTTLQYKLTDGLTFKSGIMEQNPDAPARSHAWRGSTKGSKGILLPVELELKTHLSGLPGIYNLGMLFTNAAQQDLFAGKSMEAGATDPKGYRIHNRTWFFYSGFNQQLTRHQDDATRGLSGSLSLGVADARSNPLFLTVAGAFRYHGLLDVRPEDWLGLGVSWIKMSKSARHNQQYLNDVQATDEYSNPLYHPLQGHSVNAELYYRLHAANWLQIQPGLQFWHRPGGVKQTQNAWVTGLKTVITF
ncbi:carbohydrate porin [Erwinia sp. MMLR14_017]|uniref:carbohydrate porin n=1 Tax=Erwinia sp. MMLR14_017 TaxID=3093842 RepID=UPI00299005D1|nr:carbohydrate porin [Erwinia sp. MMLR14_017]MDW8846243.1 carbohydrate porin [Erwinia sp. MMLR14_017]